MNTKMKKYTTPELRVLMVEMESVLCQSDLAGDLGAAFEKWNEEDFEWKQFDGK